MCGCRHQRVEACRGRSSQNIHNMLFRDQSDIPFNLETDEEEIALATCESPEIMAY